MDRLSSLDVTNSLNLGNVRDRFSNESHCLHIWVVARRTARLLEELDKHHKTYEYQMYADAGHAFFADYRPTYRAGPAQDIWHRLLLFYEKHLKD